MDKTKFVLLTDNELLNHYLSRILTNGGYLITSIKNYLDIVNIKDQVVLITDYKSFNNYTLYNELPIECKSLKLIVFMSESEKLFKPINKNFYGILDSKCDEREFLICVEQVLQNKLYYSSRIIQLINTVPFEKESLLSGITKREKEILVLYSKELTMVQIADHLGISPNTVNNHLYNIRIKLKLQGPNSLIRFSESHRSVLLSL